MVKVYYLKSFGLIFDLHYKMVQYNKIDLHLTKLQLKKIQDAFKNNNGTTIRLSHKNFNKNKLIHDLYLTQQQLNKLRKKIDNICLLT